MARHDQLEVVHQSFDAAVDFGFRRPADARVERLDRALGQRRKGLFGDAQRLSHLFHAHQVAVEVVAVLAHRHFELVTIVAAVGGRLANVVRDTRGAQEGPGDPVGERILGADRPDADHPVLEDAVAVQQLDHVGHHLAGLGEGALHVGGEIVGQVGRHAADAGVGQRHPPAADPLQQFVELFASFDLVEEGRERSGLHRVGGHAGQVVGDAADLRHQHSQRLRPLRHLDAHQLLDRQRPAGVVDDRRDVVQAVGEDDRLGVAAVFAHLLETAMQVADVDVGADDHLAGELDRAANRAVHGRMRGPHVEEHVFGGALGVGGGRQRMRESGLGAVQHPAVAPGVATDAWARSSLQPLLQARHVFAGVVVDLRIAGQIGNAWLLFLDRIILAQRISLELRVEQESPQIRVAAETHPEHVEDLALQPLGALPQIGECRHLGIVSSWSVDLQAHAVAVAQGVQVIDHLEALLALRAIDRRHIDQHGHVEIGIVAQEAGRAVQLARLDACRFVAVLRLGIEHRLAQLRRQSVEHVLAHGLPRMAATHARGALSESSLAA